MAIEPITAGIELVTKIIDKVIPDKGAADKAKFELLNMAANNELKILAEQHSTIRQEAASTHWMAANWRPLTMLTFVGLIVARWFGYAAPELCEAEYLKLWDIVELGLSGYVIGRSVEKVLPQMATAISKR